MYEGMLTTSCDLALPPFDMSVIAELRGQGNGATRCHMTPARTRTLAQTGPLHALAERLQQQ